MASELEKQISGLTDSYKNNTMQIAVFQLDKDSETKYGINVNKIKSFVNLHEYKINLSISDNNSIVKGFSVVRDETFPVVDLLEWLSGKKTDVSNYGKLILTEFNGITMAFPVVKIYRIFSKTSNELEEANMIDKVTYITKILLTNNEVNQKENKINNLEKQISELEKNEVDTTSEELCFILDVEKIAAELNGKEHQVDEIAKMYENEIHITKPIMIAEDSVVAQNILKKILTSLNIPFELFNNGKQLIERLKQTDNYSMVITDIEMPVLDGFSVIKWIRDNKKDSYIIVNTSMSNEGVKQKCKELGVDGFIEKTNPKEIVELIKKGT